MSAQFISRNPLFFAREAGNHTSNKTKSINNFSKYEKKLQEFQKFWLRIALVSGNVWRDDSSVLSLMSPLPLFKRDSTLLPGTEVTVWGRRGSPLVNTLFRTKLLSLIPVSWDMDCLLTLWLTLPLVPLVTVAVRLISDLYHSQKKFLVLQPIYSHRKIIKAPLLH